MSSNMLNSNDYIKSDKGELDFRVEGEFAYRELLARNRGVFKTNNGGEGVNARIFAEYCLNRRMHIFRTESGTRYAYNYKSRLYKPISVNTLSAMLLSVMDEYNKHVLSSRGCDETIRYIDCLCENYSELPEECRYIVFSNGTYDKETRKFRQDFFENIKNIYVMNYEYDTNATCEKFCMFLDDVFNSDKAVIDVIQEIFGYTLCYGQSYIDKFFFFYSVGRGGKSVLVNILRAMHGDERVSALSLDSLEQRFQLSSLVGKVVNITPEGSNCKLYNTSVLKALTGRDAVLIEEKYKSPYSTVLHTKLIVVANHYISVADDSFGFWQRVLPVHFPNIYLPLPSDGKRKNGVKYQNVGLEEELLQELPGIFNWSIKGLERLQANDWVFTHSNTIESFKSKLMYNNRPVEIFVSECIIESESTSKIKSSMLHSVFKDWAEENQLDITSYSDARKFHRELKASLQAKGIVYEVKKNSVDYYYGIQFSDDIAEG